MSPTGHHHRRLACVVVCALGVVLLGGATPAAAKGGLEDLDRVAIRESDDGVVLRLYKGAADFGGDGGGVLPESCFPNQQLVVQLSTREIASSVYFAGRRGKPFGPEGQVVGIAEDAPVAVVLARAPEGVARAEMRFRGGATDSAEPVSGGWIVFGSKLDSVPEELDRVPLLNQPGPPLGRITYINENGDRRKAKRVTAFGDSFSLDPECQPPPPPPPPLPEATGPPPADEPAARAAVEAVYELVFEPGDADPDDRLAVIEDGESVRAAQEKIAETYGDIGPTTVKVDEIRFLNETEAAVRFDILLDGNPITATSVGRALFLDGTWKMAKATYCELLGRGGAIC